jgi:hypothetical protein
MKDEFEVEPMNVPPVAVDEAEGFEIGAETEAARLENEGVVVPINGADEKPRYYKKNGEVKPVTITVAGSHSDYYRRAEKAIRQRKLKPGKLTGQTFYDDNIEKVAACTLGWEGFFSRESKDGPLVPIEPTQHNIKEMYKRCTWVLEQVMEAMNDHASFFVKGSKQR